MALQSGDSIENAQPLFSPLYYVSRALEPYAEINEPQNPAELRQALDAGLSMLVLADIGVLPGDRQEMIGDWVERGGILLRFAGPRLAGAQDPLVPVTLREGGRSLGSAMSWETPQSCRPFHQRAPSRVLNADPEVKVVRQVLAEPDADLPDKVWASLEDGTPLVTASHAGQRPDRAVSRDRQCRLVEPAAVRPLRRHAAPDRRSCSRAGGGARLEVLRQCRCQPAAFHAWLACSPGPAILSSRRPTPTPSPRRDSTRPRPRREHPAGLYRRGGRNAPSISRITGEAADAAHRPIAG